MFSRFFCVSGQEFILWKLPGIASSPFVCNQGIEYNAETYSDGTYARSISIVEPGYYLVYAQVKSNCSVFTEI